MGLLDIGYHYLIQRHGSIVEVRPHWAMGSHAPGFNHNSVSICLLGGEDEAGEPADNFTDAQVVGLVRLAAHLHSIYPGIRLVGHSELQRIRSARGRQRQCPMMDMDKLREAVNLTTQVPT